MDDAQSSRRDLRSVKSDGRSGTSKPWTTSQKHIVEIMCGLVLYTASERKLTVEQIVNRAGILFKNVEPNSDMQQKFHVRLKHVMAKSRFISQDETSWKNTIWEFNKKKTKEFMEMVNKFVDEKPELAEEHNVKEFSSYSTGNSRKRGHAAVSPPDSASNAPVVPKKRGSNIPKIKSVNENKSVRVPREASSSASILPNKRSAFALALVSDIVAYNERDAAKKAFALKELEEILDNVATKDDVKKLTNEVKEHIQNTIEEKNAEMERRMMEKLETGFSELRTTFTGMISEFFRTLVSVTLPTPAPTPLPVPISAPVPIPVIADTQNEGPVDEHRGMMIENEETGETYEVIKRIGDGSFGKVFKTTDAGNRVYAIKVAMKSSNVLDQVNDEIKMIETIKAAKERGDFPPRFLAVPDHFEGIAFGQKRHCERMECYTIDLFGAIYEQNLTFNPAQTLHVIGQMSSALAYLHRFGFIHADVKPDNIMLSDMEIVNGKISRIEARLIDFNVIVKMDEQPCDFCGQSVPYRAPEMAIEMPCDNKIDVYALGLVALQMATGSKGFYMILDEEVKGFSEIDANAAILGEVQRLIGPIPLEMCRKSRNPRYHRFVGFKKLVPDRAPKITMDEVCNSLGKSGIVGDHLASTIRRMLTIDPMLRPDSANIAKILTKYCVPQLPIKA